MGGPGGCRQTRVKCGGKPPRYVVVGGETDHKMWGVGRYSLHFRGTIGAVVEVAQTWSPLLAVVLAGFALALAAIAVLVTARSLPSKLVSDFHTLSKDFETLQASLESLLSKWHAHREAAEAVLEELENTDERVERNRKRTAAREGKLKQKENDGAGDEPVDPYIALQVASRSAHPDA